MRYGFGSLIPDFGFGSLIPDFGFGSPSFELRPPSSFELRLPLWAAASPAAPTSAAAPIAVAGAFVFSSRLLPPELAPEPPLREVAPLELRRAADDRFREPPDRLDGDLLELRERLEADSLEARELFERLAAAFLDPPERLEADFVELPARPLVERARRSCSWSRPRFACSCLVALRFLGFVLVSAIRSLSLINFWTRICGCRLSGRSRCGYAPRIIRWSSTRPRTSARSFA